MNVGVPRLNKYELSIVLFFYVQVRVGKRFVHRLNEEFEGTGEKGPDWINTVFFNKQERFGFLFYTYCSYCRSRV